MKIYEDITGKTKLIGVIGNPIEHSISPQLHNTLNKHLGIDAVYIPMKAEKDSLEDVVKGLKATNFVGFNVTIPFKNEIIRYLDTCSEEAAQIGAVNTVVNKDGVLHGYNTDAEGFARSFKMEAATDFQGKTIAIVGAGGVARAIAVKLAIEKAEHIYIINRTLSKAEEISDLICKNFTCESSASIINSAESFEDLKSSDIIINATSIGMYPQIDENPIPSFSDFNNNQIVYDTIYNPSKTKLLSVASSKGCKSINGFGMLIFQGVLAYEMWTDLRISKADIKSLFKAFSDYLTL